MDDDDVVGAFGCIAAMAFWVGLIVVVLMALSRLGRIADAIERAYPPTAVERKP